MKAIQYILGATVILYSCSPRQSGSDGRHTAITVLVDSTDSLMVYPNEDDILGLFDFSNDMKKAATFRYRPITDKLLNPVITIHIDEADVTERQNREDYVYYREEIVSTFCNDILATFQRKQNTSNAFHELNNSEIFLAIADELTAISSLQADKKILLVYSNLAEKSNVSAYNNHFLQELKNTPDKVFKSLKGDSLIPTSLKGTQVLFIYQSANRKDEERFLGIYEHLYKRQLEKRGAKVTLQTTSKFKSYEW